MNSWEGLDFKVSLWVREHIQNPRLNSVLSKINRGEIFALFLIPYILFFSKVKNSLLVIAFLLFFAYVTDRSVLFLKKYFARKRPLVQVMGKVDKNPDMKHSFPSAHSANSMVVVFILVFGFQQSPFFFLFSLFAGLGRILTMHHFLSDIFGGWAVGAFWGFLGILCWNLVLPFF